IGAALAHKNIRIQSGVALSTAVQGVYFTSSDRWKTAPVAGPTPSGAVCPLGTYGDEGRAAWLRAAPTALLFEALASSLKRSSDEWVHRQNVMAVTSSNLRL